jgi:hypothetical protein
MISDVEKRISHRDTEKKKKIEISPSLPIPSLCLCGKRATAIAPIAARMINTANEKAGRSALLCAGSGTDIVARVLVHDGERGSLRRDVD